MNVLDIFQNIITFFTDQDLLARGILLILLILYSLFSIILARQIFVLTGVVNQISFSPIFKVLGLLHVALSVGLLIFVIFSLL